MIVFVTEVNTQFSSYNISISYFSRHAIAMVWTIIEISVAKISIVELTMGIIINAIMVIVVLRLMPEGRISIKGKSA